MGAVAQNEGFAGTDFAEQMISWFREWWLMILLALSMTFLVGVSLDILIKIVQLSTVITYCPISTCIISPLAFLFHYQTILHKHLHRVPGRASMIKVKTTIKIREDNTKIIATYTTTLFGLVVRVREVYCGWK